jgi:hypothetical protein
MSSQPDDTPATISVPAAVLLGVAVTSATTLAIIAAAQHVVPEGTTALLASLTALTGTGVIICAVAGRSAAAIAELRLGQDKILAALGERPRPGVAGEAAIREIVEQVAAEELGAREAVHAQGYAEGYVDGIDRRSGGGASVN